MKKLLFVLLFLFGIVNVLYCSPSNSISIPNSFSPNTTISSSAVNANFNEAQTKFNVHSHTDITSLGAITTGTWSATVIDKAYGGTGNAYGIGLPSGAVFFMISGSCPSGTTDVSATYANKFVKINATAGTSSGTILTGTTAGHTLIVSEMPAHTHANTATVRGRDGTGSTSLIADGNGEPTQGTLASTASAGSDGAHDHSLTTATTLEPSSITMICCEVQ